MQVIDPASPDARKCLEDYFAELDRRFDTGFDPARTRPTEFEEMRPPRGVFAVARMDGVAVGCGALRFHPDGSAEVKRMWVAPGARGHGIGWRLLTALEQMAVERGSTRVRLDTNRTLREAIAMYRSAGYVEVKAFNDEPYAHHWFEKVLTPARTG